MAWADGSIASVRGWDQLSQEIKDLCGTAGLENWSFVENIPAGTGLGTSGAAAYSVDVFECSDVNGSGLASAPFYFCLEIPVADLQNGTATLSYSCAFETYEGGTDKRFTRPISNFGNVTPVGEGWRTTTLNQYSAVLGQARASYSLGSLFSTGFSYWIKMTKNTLFIGTTQGTTRACAGFFLMESMVTNPALDGLDQVPLAGFTNAGGIHYCSKLPGVTTALGAANGGDFYMLNVSGLINTWYGLLFNANGDIWASPDNIYKTRILVRHVRGSNATPASLQLLGIHRGVANNDLWYIRAANATEAAPEDTITIDAETWVVLAHDPIALCWMVTRKN